uniref:Uncharacterized protein n=1 Tax=Lygus hesperus TaxID=30085 RepID=A0A146M1I5_LYGHE
MPRYWRIYCPIPCCRICLWFNSQTMPQLCQLYHRIQVLNRRALIRATHCGRFHLCLRCQILLVRSYVVCVCEQNGSHPTAPHCTHQPVLYFHSIRTEVTVVQEERACWYVLDPASLLPPL